jgi:hypothetical protein
LGALDSLNPHGTSVSLKVKIAATHNGCCKTHPKTDQKTPQSEASLPTKCSLLSFGLVTNSTDRFQQAMKHEAVKL